MNNCKWSEFGLAIKHKLIEEGKTQNWLVSKVRENTGLHFDTWYLYRIMTDQSKTPKIRKAIIEILNLDCQ